MVVSALSYPAKAAQISNRKLPTNQPQSLSRFTLRFQPIIKHLIQPLRLRLIPIDSVINLRRRIAVKVVSLSLHWTNTRLHPHQPLDRFPVLVAVVGEADLVIFVVLLAEIELDGSAFEDSLGFAGCGVYYCWDAAICCQLRSQSLIVSRGKDVC